MGLAHSPGVVTNGLVFYYDMLNTARSWKGAPTTNLFSGNLSATNATKALPNGAFAGLYNGWQATGVSNDNPRVTLFNGSITVSASTFYTLSCLYWSSNSLLDEVYLKFSDTGWTESTYYIQPFTSQSTSRNGSYTITDLGSGWKYCTGTFQTLSTTTTLQQLFFDVDTAGVDVFVTNFQLEQQLFATPFVNGTRTNTQSLVDLTNNNTITANSLTYNADGTFSFNGSTNFITFPENSTLNTQTPTVEVWVKTNATTQNGFFFEKGTVNSQYALFQEGANITWRHTTNVGSLTAAAASFINTTQYAQIVGTYTAGDRRIYVNGVQVAADSLSYTLPTNTNGCSIGVYGGATGSRGYYFNGTIGAVRVYNRALTAAEVKQNFNALRGRYGV